MGLLSPYVGRYVSAASASEYLDIGTIASGCSAAISEASFLNSFASKLSSITAVVDANALCIDGMTIQGVSDECSNNIVSVQNEIVNIANQVLASAEAAYNQIQERLNQEAYINDQNMALYYSNKRG